MIFLVLLESKNIIKIIGRNSWALSETNIAIFDFFNPGDPDDEATITSNWYKMRHLENRRRCSWWMQSISQVAHAVERNREDRHGRENGTQNEFERTENWVELRRENRGGTREPNAKSVVQRWNKETSPSIGALEHPTNRRQRSGQIPETRPTLAFQTQERNPTPPL